MFWKQSLNSNSFLNKWKENFSVPKTECKYHLPHASPIELVATIVKNQGSFACNIGLLFDVIKIQNGGAREIEKRKKAILLFYFVGHGISNNSTSLSFNSRNNRK